METARKCQKWSLLVTFSLKFGHFLSLLRVSYRVKAVFRRRIIDISEEKCQKAHRNHLGDPQTGRKERNNGYFWSLLLRNGQNRALGHMEEYIREIVGICLLLVTFGYFWLFPAGLKRGSGAVISRNVRKVSH